MLGVFISNSALAWFASYAPIGVIACAGVYLAMHSRHRLDRLEEERREARERSDHLQQQVQEIAFQMAVSEKELLGMLRALLTQKAKGTPITQEEIDRAAEIVFAHQATIEALLDG